MTSTSPRAATRRLLAVGVAAGMLLLTACGDDEADAVATEAPGAATTVASDDGPSPAVTTAASGDAPLATVSPDLPAAYEGEVGPIAVIGTPLDPLGGVDVAQDPALGKVAPTILGRDTDGNPIKLDPTDGGPTMVVFLAHWCPHCNAEIPELNELRDDGRFPENLRIIGVSTAAAPDRPNWPPSEWLRKMDWTYPAIADGLEFSATAIVPIAAQAYGVDGFPFTALLDADGKVVARWSGERGGDEVIAAIEQYLPAG